MAAPCQHVGRSAQRKCRFLLNNVDRVWSSHRSFGWTSLLRQQTAEPLQESAETIVIPRKKTWSKEAVLEALASTVTKDATAYPYQFQDDPFLSPKTFVEFKLYSLSLESGQSAAKYFINNNPKFFAKDFAQPHIPCLMPEAVVPLLDEVSEEALKERIHLRKVTAAVDLYDQLLQAGTPVSVETTHDLLDLLCLYSDREPTQEDGPLQDTEGSEEETKRSREKPQRPSDHLRSSWKNNNNAERIFNLLPEKDTRSYSALIRGAVMHGAQAKAFSFYTDMLNSRVAGDVHIFNALLSGVNNVREKHSERWDLTKELLTQMQQQNVQPNLLTFNNILKSLKRSGAPLRFQALQTLNEMKAVGIAPSLASFTSLLNICFKPTSGHSNTGILHDILSELEGTSFTCQDPDDVLFFLSAMRICLEYKDLELGYKIQSLVDVGENWRLLGNPGQQNLYYGRFFHLLCQMENIDVVLKWYRRLVPSLCYPTYQALRSLMQALDTDSRLDLLPTIWKDIRMLGQDNKEAVVLELLSLMSRDKQPPEIQESFAQCALDVKSVFDGDKGSARLQWKNSSASHIATLLLRADRTEEAWDVLQIFKAKNLVPVEGLLEDFLSACRGDASSQRAVEVVQLSAAFCLSSTPQLAERALEEFELTEEQRALLTELQPAAEASD